MSRQFEGSVQGHPGSSRRPTAVAFVHHLASSPAFKDLFIQGMALVETTAAYLDGRGRAEARALPRAAALAYATESMRLTTRLMQIASWLLLQRAVNEGELTSNQALSERHRVKLSRQELACGPDVFEQLPQTLRELSQRSLRLQERIIHLDQGLALARSPEPIPRDCEVALQHERLRRAFSNSPADCLGLASGHG
jgi:regulator of CtrA degradation